MYVVLAFFSVVLIFTGIWEIATHSTRKRAALLSGAAQKRMQTNVELSEAGIRGIWQSLASLAAPRGAAYDRIAKQLDLAGIHQTPEVWTAKRLRLPLVTAVAAALLAPLSLALTATLAFVTVILWFWPLTTLNNTLKRRKRKIGEQMSDFADFMALLCDTGASLLGALQRSSRAIGGPLGEEMQRVARRATQDGLTPALREFQDRIATPQADAIAITLIEANKYGSAMDISRSLRNYSIAQDEQRRYQAEQEAQRKTILALFPVFVFDVLPMMGLMLLPTVASMMSNGGLLGL